jgi:hypothetical protein
MVEGPGQRYDPPHAHASVGGLESNDTAVSCGHAYGASGIRTDSPITEVRRDSSRSGVSKIEARLSYVDDKTLLYLAEVLKAQLQELFPTRPPGNRIYDFIEKLETTRF